MKWAASWAKIRANSEPEQSNAIRRSRRKDPAWTGPRRSRSPGRPCTRIGPPRSVGIRRRTGRARGPWSGSSNKKRREAATFDSVALLEHQGHGIGALAVYDQSHACRSSTPQTRGQQDVHLIEAGRLRLSAREGHGEADAVNQACDARVRRSIADARPVQHEVERV